jgi:hypothetical protein
LIQSAAFEGGHPPGIAVHDGGELLSGKSGDLHTHALINRAEFIETGGSTEMNQYCNRANMYSMFFAKTN